MKDIKLDKWYKKVIYYSSFVGILNIFILIPLLLLIKFGDERKENTIDKKDILNKTWQKFMFVYGAGIYFIIFFFVFCIVVSGLISLIIH